MKNYEQTAREKPAWRALAERMSVSNRPRSASGGGSCPPCPGSSRPMRSSTARFSSRQKPPNRSVSSHYLSAVRGAPARTGGSLPVRLLIKVGASTPEIATTPETRFVNRPVHDHVRVGLRNGLKIPFHTQTTLQVLYFKHLALQMRSGSVWMPGCSFPIDPRIIALPWSRIQ